MELNEIIKSIIQQSQVDFDTGSMRVPIYLFQKLSDAYVQGKKPDPESVVRVRRAIRESRIDVFLEGRQAGYTYNHDGRILMYSGTGAGSIHMGLVDTMKEAVEHIVWAADIMEF